MAVWFEGTGLPGLSPPQTTDWSYFSLRGSFRNEEGDVTRTSPILMSENIFYDFLQALHAPKERFSFRHISVEII